MNKEKVLSIQKRIRHYSIALAVGMIAVFAMTQLLAAIFQSASTRVWMEYNCFARYWNVLQEADRVLYRYAQTPVQKDREDAAALIEELESDAQIIHDAAGQSQLQDLQIITGKYVRTAEDLLGSDADTETRIQWYHILKEYKEISDGLYHTLYQMMQNYLDASLTKLERTRRILNAGAVGVGAAIIVFLVGWIGRIGHRIVRPIRELTAQAQEVTGGNRMIEMRYRENIEDELDILNNAFYQMLETNNQSYDMLKKQGELEKRLALTKLRLLQSRVNPHFMFNTLNLIAGLAVEEDAERTTEMLIKTAKYLRYALEYLDKAVRLEEELGHAMDYMEIQKERFEDRFVTILEIQEECKDAIVPSMILQPLCENALEYGMMSWENTTQIVIRSCIRGDRLELSVEDNGAGMEPEKLAQIRENLNNAEEYDDAKGIGIVNTYQRIRSFYLDQAVQNGNAGEQVSCQVESEPMVCTRICFEMPLLLRM